jgi:RNA polymerase sigma factor (sigma-70 family)
MQKESETKVKSPKKSKKNNIVTEQTAKDLFDINVTAKSLSKKKVEKKPKKEKNIQKLAMQFIEDPTEKNFELLFERINWGLRSYIFKIVNDDEATTEVVSKTLEAIYFKRDQYKPENAKFSTWMYRIAFNNSLKYNQSKLSSQGKVNVDFEDLYDSTVTNDTDECCPISGFTEAEASIDIVYEDGKFVNYDREKIISDFYDASVKSIQELPDNLRVVMYDRLINNKKIEDIAYDNMIPVSSVKNWLRKGKVELQEIIKANHSGLYNMYMEMLAC